MALSSHLRLAQGLAAVLLLLLPACAPSSLAGDVETTRTTGPLQDSGTADVFVSTGENLAPDPRSTLELGGMGGGTLVPLRFSDIPRISDLAVVVDVVDVKPSLLNTPDGRLPPIDPRGDPDQLKGIRPETPVVVRVVEVLAERPAVASEWSAGQLQTIILPGGYFTTILGPEEAASLGVLVPDGREGPGEIESESPPTSPVDFSIGLSLSASLTEGDRVLLFLRREVDKYGRTRWTEADPRAFFYIGAASDLTEAIFTLPGAFDQPGSVADLIAALRVAEGLAITSGDIDTLRAQGLEP